MSQTLPQKLLNSPLREAIIEVRFESAMPGLGDILPGVLYSTLKGDYPEVTTLPLANVPRTIRDKNPLFLYQHSHRLSGKSGMVQIGDRVVAVNVQNYPGWQSLRTMAASLIAAVKQTGLVKEAERFSMKYTNVIESQPPEHQLSLINMQVRVNQQVPMEAGFQLRYEVQSGAYTTIVQIVPNAVAKENDKEIEGLLLDLDTVRDKPGREFWSDPTGLLDEAHLACKTYFVSLLTKEALERMQPVW